jgi:hypothetical protein
MDFPLCTLQVSQNWNPISLPIVSRIGSLDMDSDMSPQTSGDYLQHSLRNWLDQDRRISMKVYSDAGPALADGSWNLLSTVANEDAVITIHFLLVSCGMDWAYGHVG